MTVNTRLSLLKKRLETLEQAKRIYLEHERERSAEAKRSMGQAIKTDKKRELQWLRALRKETTATKRSLRAKRRVYNKRLRQLEAKSIRLAKIHDDNAKHLRGW